MYTFIFNSPERTFHISHHDAISFELHRDRRVFEITRRVRYESIRMGIKIQIEREEIETAGITSIKVFFHDTLIREFT